MGERATTGSRRDQILVTAAGLFARHGFHGVSIDDLGAAVGISGPALYRHFRSKEAMLGQMLIGISARLLTEGAQRAQAGGTPEQVLDSLIAFHVEFALREPELITVQFRDLDQLATADSDRVRRLQSDYAQLWATALRRVRPELDAATARTAVRAAFGLINSTPYSARLATPATAALLQRMARAALLAA